MIQNIKVDIVYYMTATDFEFEFNLGSCCHMRLLNDKVKDKKSFVNSLARAVSRSQIIIACGPLFGEDGLISTVATAINHGLKITDNKAYGIASSEPIEIISDSVPLVTPEGYFGGCIVESGKQSIILLSENRTIRKAIMKTLVHPYIADISVMQFSEQISKPLPDTDRKEEVYPAEEIPAPQENIEEVIEQQSEIKPELPDVAKTEETEEENRDYNMTVDFSEETESENKEPETADEQETESKVIANDSYIQADIYKEPKKSRKGINISILLIVLVLSLVIIALCYFVLFMPLYKGISVTEYFKQIFDISSTVSV